MTGATTTEERGGAGGVARPTPLIFGKGLQRVKDELGIEALAAEYGEFKRVGNGRLVGHCVSPDHEDKTPSMNIDTEDQRYRCFGCGVYGDLLDFFMLAEGWPEGDSGMALHALAKRFGVQLPRRPRRWHHRQDEKARIREAAKKHVAEKYQKRLTRLYAPLVLLGGETPEEELKELRELAAALWPVSLDMAARRVNGEE